MAQSVFEPRREKGGSLLLNALWSHSTKRCWICLERRQQSLECGGRNVGREVRKPWRKGVREKGTIVSVRRMFEQARRSAVKVAVVAGLVLATVALAPAASAATANLPGYGPLNASGCTSVSVGKQCIIVNGSGSHVNYATSQHDTITLQKCNLTARFLYEQGGVSGTMTSPLYTGCYSAGYAVQWNANQNFDSGSQMCATSKDSLTSGLWNNTACETIG